MTTKNYRPTRKHDTYQLQNFQIFMHKDIQDQKLIDVDQNVDKNE